MQHVIHENEFQVLLIQMMENQDMTALLSPHNFLAPKLTQVAQAFCEDVGDMDSHELASYCALHQHCAVVVLLSVFKANELGLIIHNKAKELQAFEEERDETATNQVKKKKEKKTKKQASLSGKCMLQNVQR